MNQRGATIIEILVATVIFAAVATGAVQALAVAAAGAPDERAGDATRRRSPARGWSGCVAATAASTANGSAPSRAAGPSETVDPQLGLERLDVNVSWQDGGERTLTLSSLARTTR